MGEALLKTATMRSDGTAQPLLTNQNGALITANSNDYMSRRGFYSSAKVAEIRKNIWNKYIESEYSIIDENLPARTWTTATPSDGTIKWDSLGSLKITTSISSFSTSTLLSSEGVDMSDFTSIRFTIDTPDPDKITNFKILFDAPDYQNRFTLPNGDVANGDVRRAIKSIFGHGTIAIERNSFVSSGSANWSQVTRAYIVLGNANGETVYAIISDLKLVKQKPKNAKFILRMDDGLKSVYDVAEPVLRNYNVPAALFVNPGYVLKGEHAQHISYGGLPAMSFEEIQELHAKGWSVSGHTYYHNLYRDPTIDNTVARTSPRYRYHQAYHDLAAVQDWLIENGFGDGAYGSVYGNHYYNSETMAAALDVVPLDFSQHSKITAWDPLPWGSSLRHIRDTDILSKTGDTYPNVDSVVADRGLCVIMMHRFDGDGISGSMSAETLDDFIAYLVANENIDIITVADLVNGTPVALR